MRPIIVTYFFIGFWKLIFEFGDEYRAMEVNESFCLSSLDTELGASTPSPVSVIYFDEIFRNPFAVSSFAQKKWKA